MTLCNCCDWNHTVLYMYLKQKLSASEKRGPRASFKLSKSLKLFKKKGAAASADDTEEPKGDLFYML